ncbi:MAG: amino acid adenylation domain-containing protein [Vicinamibacterales bacterium]
MNSRLADLYRRIHQLDPSERARFREMLREEGIDLADSIIWPIRPHPTRVAASFAQRRIWFLQQFDPDNVYYNVEQALVLEGDLDVPSLGAALSDLVTRHEVLRTTFEMEGEAVYQVIHSPEPVSVAREDWSGSAGDDGGLARRLRPLVRQPFDLERGPLLRCWIVRRSPGAHVLLLVVHHIVADGWSAGILIRELSEAYSARARGKAPDWAPLPVQYADYALWQRAWLDSGPRAAQLAYWTEQLAGAPRCLQLASFRSPSEVLTDAGANELVSFDPALVESLEASRRSERVSLFVTVLSAFVALLVRQTGERDILIGTPFANRSRSELEPLVGFVANTLVLRFRVDGDPSFRDLVRQARGVVLSAFRHADLPFEELVEELNPDRDLNRTPLFQVWFAMGEAPAAPVIPGLSASILEVPQKTAHFDLVLDLWHSRTGLSGKLEYRTDLFSSADARRVIDQLENILRSAAGDPGRRISELELLSADELRFVLSSTLDARAAVDGFLGAFAEQVRRRPGAPATLCGDARLTFGELDRRANRLARRLRVLGLAPEEVVAIRMPPSPALSIALLGVWKAGGVVLPLDPAEPSERLRLMTADARVRRVIVDHARGKTLDGLGCETLTLDGGEEEDAGAIGAPHGDAAACVFYTSGSTGAPRGVLVTHRAVSWLSAQAERAFGLTGEDRFLQFGPVGFDVLLEELLPAWRAGAAVVFRDEYRPISPGELTRMIDRHAVTHVELPEGYWTQLVDELVAHAARLPHSLRVMLVGCNRIRRSSFERWRRFDVRLIHVYGLTELGVTSTVFDSSTMEVRADDYVPAGRPLDGASLYILDGHGNPCGIGVQGELFIGGPGVARGYLNDAGATAERFVPDRFSPVPGARAFRTGDLARWRPEGTIDLLGRADRQLKIRGFRVELAEVEATLGGHPSVRACHVEAQADASGELRLVAFLVCPPPEPGLSDFRDFLRARLPSFMHPSALMFLPALPYTTHGKIDSRALPAVDLAPVERTYVPPAPGTEEAIAAIWRELLGLTRVSADDNFFDAGGHSLKAMQLISRLRATFDVELSLRVVFDCPTIRALAIAVAASKDASERAQTIDRRFRDGGPVLSFAQEALWFLHQIDPESPAYNLPAALAIAGDLSADALEQSLRVVTERHETLRTTFHTVNGQPVPSVTAVSRFSLGRVDLTPVAESEVDEVAASLARREHARPFDMEREHLIRATLVRLGARRHVLLLTLHHIVADGWSVNVLLQELQESYRAIAAGDEPRLCDLPIQYLDFARWQRWQLPGPALESQVAYWLERLRDRPPALELLSDRPRPPVLSYRGATYGFEVGAALAQSVRKLAERRRATLFMVLLAAFKALLHRWTGASDLVVGSFVANRHRAEVQPLIGLFVNAIVLRTGLSGDPSFDTLVDRTREATLGAYAHQEVPFEILVDRLGAPRDLSRNALFQIVFSLEVSTDLVTSSSDLELKPYGVGAGSTQFDLSWDMNETMNGVAGRITYSTDLFGERLIAQLARSFEALLESAVEDPSQPLSALRILRPDERRALAAWSGMPQPAAGICVHETFEAHARRTPDAPCVTSGDRCWTYREVDSRANALAHRLRACAVGPEAVVALHLNRSPMLPTAILAVLKAGGVCLPIDRRAPADLVRFQLADSGARVLVCEPDARDVFGTFNGALVCPEEDGATGDSLDPPSCPLSPLNLAYLLYTSGSTGRPKGVGVSHAALAGYVSAVVPEIGLTSGDRVLQFASPGFDVLFEELFPAWSAGAAVVVEPFEAIPSCAELLQCLDASGVTVVELPAVYWTHLVSDASALPPRLRRVIVGCEPPARAALTRWRDFGVPLTHVFGLTETTITSTMFHLSAGSTYGGASRLPIGRRLANTTLQILDANLQLVPPGAPGELYIGGTALARGYTRDAGLTAERFVPNPSCTIPGARLYRTGDRVRMLDDGNLEFLGREDDQISLRGYRIEAAEIEVALECHPAVRKAAVVVASADAETDRASLVAYIEVRGTPPESRELRQFLKERLPSYMIPGYFVALDALPTTAGGKLDRRRLPVARPAIPPGDRQAAASTDLERTVIRVWETVLGLDGIGPHDDFFEIGGDSLLSIKVVAALREMGLAVASRDIFQRSTPADLADFLAGAGSIPAASAERDEPAVAGRGDPDRLAAEDFPAARLSQDELDRLIAHVSGETCS